MRSPANFNFHRVAKFIKLFENKSKMMTNPFIKQNLIIYLFVYFFRFFIFLNISRNNKFVVIKEIIIELV